MNELFGTLLPLLMSGAGIGDILRQLGGSGMSAASTDGLSSAISQSLWNARMRAPMRPYQGSINSVFETMVHNAGFNPYSAGGQGFVSLLGSAYHIAPDIIGGAFGIPNYRQFFSTIANGASGIGMASGHGRTDVLNPYSVLASHRRAMEMGQAVYGMAVRPNGGYDMSFTHGMNMGELGKVTQRLLSSDIAYRDENGRRVDPSTAEDFSKNLKRLGTKFNEAVSMLSKVTGSVEDALKVMDKMAGGNFLGGTEAQASEIANRAKRMAAAIRITSAMAGVSPSEAYQRMSGLMIGMAGWMGVSAGVAEQSGFGAMMGNLAFNTTMGYNMWLATHPNATDAQKNQMRLATEGQAQLLARSDSMKLAAALADNADAISDRDMKTAISNLRSGNTKFAARILRNLLGGASFNAAMTDPGTIMATRARAFEKHRDVLEMADSANLQGGLWQDIQFGVRQVLDQKFSGMDEAMSYRIETGGFETERRRAVKDELVRMAVAKGRFTRDGAERMTEGQLREYLDTEYDSREVSRRANRAAIERQFELIDSNTMDANGEASVRRRLLQDIADLSGVTGDEKTHMENLVEEGRLYEAARRYMQSAGIDTYDQASYMYNLTGGRLFREEAEERKNKFKDEYASQNGQYTTEERLREIERKSNLKAFNDFKGLNDLIVNGGSGEFSDAIKARTGDAYGTFGEGAQRLVSGIFGDKLGELEGDDLKDLEARIGKSVSEKMRGGMPWSEAIEKALGEDEKTKDFASKVGSDKRFSEAQFRSSVVSVVNEKYGKNRTAELEELKRLSQGEFGNRTEQGAAGRYVELLRSAGYDIDAGRAREILDAIDGTKGSGRSAIDKLTEMAEKVGIKDDTYYAMAGTGSADNAMVAMSAMRFIREGGSLGDAKKLFNLDDASVKLLGSLDQETAEKNNAIANAVGGGGESFKKEAVARAEQRMLELKEQLGDTFTAEKVKAAFGTGPEAEKAMADLKGALSGREDVKSDIAFLGTLGERKYGKDKTALEVMFEGKEGIDRAKQDAGGKADDQMLEIMRKSAQKEDASYQVLSGIGQIIQKVAPFLENPIAAINSSDGIKVKLW